jgi:hypothetical protein
MLPISERPRNRRGTERAPSCLFNHTVRCKAAENAAYDGKKGFLDSLPTNL